ncbi:MAG TPA: hypothetical protein VFV79_05115 [Saprospiraceae bacterium]|nr:hypothetical protein [Saprospiraceae bacterium]
MFKKLFYPVTLLLVLVTLVSCHKDDREELFVINHVVDFTITPGLNTFDTHITDIFPIESLLNARLDETGTAPTEVNTIEPKRAILSSVFGDINLEFIDQVSILIYDPYHPSDRVEFAYKDRQQIPYTKKYSIELFPGIADVKHWMELDYFGIEIRLNYRQVTPSLTQMRLDFDFRALAP